MTHRGGLNPFAPRAKCAKCGAVGEHRTEYRALRSLGEAVADEHLRRECRRCGYEWEEACVDAPAEMPKAGSA